MRKFGTDLTNLTAPSLSPKKHVRPDKADTLLDFLAQQQASACPRFTDDCTQFMRSVLVNWMVQVCNGFKLQDRTFQLSVKYLDRYLQFTTPSKQDLQLLGVTCLFIASKIQENMPFSVTVFSQVTDHSSSPQQIIAMQCSILECLDYELIMPVPLDFIRMLAGSYQVDQRGIAVAHYVCERGLVRHLGNFKDRQIAEASLYVACKLLGKDGMCGVKKSSRSEILVAGKQICMCLTQEQPLEALQVKFAQKRHFEVSKLKLMRV